MKASVCAWKPNIDVWYDRDQFGEYLKVRFYTYNNSNFFTKISGKVYCRGTSRLLFSEASVGNGFAETSWGLLPIPPDCGEYYAQGDAITAVQAYSDDWVWAYGSYPA